MSRNSTFETSCNRFSLTFSGNKFSDTVARTRSIAAYRSWRKDDNSESFHQHGVDGTAGTLDKKDPPGATWQTGHVKLL